MLSNALRNLLSLLRVEYSPVSHAEKIVSALGGFAGIFVISWVSWLLVGTADAPLVVASMGASAALIFGVPHGQLSQPWPLLGGHLFSAFIGVTCAKYVPDVFVASALAVGLAIGVMHYLRCLHPPGGATALTAVIGGTQLQALGYQYVLTPVMLNAGLILLTALVVNNFFPWRRYPAFMMNLGRKTEEAQANKTEPEETGQLSPDDLIYAIKQMDEVIDVSAGSLRNLFALASHHARRGTLRPEQIVLGRYYSNGEYGERWSVRHVVDESGPEGHPTDRLIYKVVAGEKRRSSATCSREELANWARHEVFLNENSWQRVRSTDTGE